MLNSELLGVSVGNVIFNVFVVGVRFVIVFVSVFDILELILVLV